MHLEIEADYDTQFLFPPALEDWVPADHPARFLREYVDSLPLHDMGFKKRVALEGRPSYSPGLMLKAVLYAYMNGIVHLRDIERACMEHMSAIWLTGNNAPDHTTIGRFIVDNRDPLQKVFRMVVRTAYDAGIVGVALHAVDGTKIKSKSSNRGVVKREELEQLLEAMQEVADGMIRAAEEEMDDESGGYRLPKELTEKGELARRIKRALGKMDEAGRDSINPDEPEARLMNCGGKIDLAYNAQVVVDEESGMIVAEDVVNEEMDKHQLTPMIEKVEENVGKNAEETIADAGYYSADELAKAQERNWSVLVNANPPGEGEFHWSRFTYDEENDCVICPLGNRLEFNCIDNCEKTPRREYKCRRFRECEKRFECSKSKRMGRRIRIGPHHAALLHNHRKLRIEQHRERLKRRKAIVERVFGVIKECTGFRRWTVRGLKAVKTQWVLICTAYDLKMLYRAWANGGLAFESV